MSPAALVAVSLCASPSALRTFSDPGELPHLTAKSAGREVELPLRHTAVKAEVSGFAARVSVTQRFQNDFTEAIEVVYVFPLPERAAVDDFRLTVGDRVIEGVIKRRADARREYTDAKKRGHTAALLEQERPNVFTQSIANIPPGQSIEVRTQYVQVLGYDAGEYEFVFPMVVGPRYQPVDQKSPRLPTPLVAPEGFRAGQDISIDVAVSPGVPVTDFDVPTHEVSGMAIDQRLELQLVPRDRIPNRDFVLRFRIAGPKVSASVLTHRDARGGFFALTLQPPALDVDARVGSRELVFVVDVSGSMSGLPLWLCQQAMKEALTRLRPVDTFNVITFAGSTGRLFPQAERASEQNVEKARRFVETMTAGGGTEMLDAIDAALRPQVQPGRHRYVFFMTDGFVGNESQIQSAAHTFVQKLDRRGQRARVFSYGVGSAPNRELIAGLAEAGKGLAYYATNREDPVRGVDRFFRVIDAPVLTDVQIDWGGLAVEAVSPALPQDLFLSRRLVVLGRYGSAGSAVVKVRGVAPSGQWEELAVPVEFPAVADGNEALASLWARSRVQDLESSLWGPGEGAAEQRLAQVREDVTQLGLSYRLLTEHTAFIAVDRSRQVGNGDPRLIVQPVDAPEDVDAYAAGALPWVASRGASEGIRELGGGVGEAHGMGGLGIRGTGSGGGGYGYGYGYGSATLRGGTALGGASVQKRLGPLDASPMALAGRLAPAVSVAQPVVMGSLDKSLILRVIQRHAAEPRYCYELALRSDPALHGRLVLRWTITSSGAVADVQISENALNDAVASCLVQRVRLWQFPSVPEAGTVVISFPWTFQPAQ